MTASTNPSRPSSSCSKRIRPIAKAPIADLNIVEILVLQKKAEEAQEARFGPGQAL